MISKDTPQPGPFTSDEIQKYLDVIQLPKKFHPANNPPLNVEFLNALHVHQISTIPYENLDLHYSTKREIKLDPRHCYEKFVERGNGRGGYCMEVSSFGTKEMIVVGC
jgi:arylamine N-acetyltransferase